jgi:cellulose synthase/poly-beta-1,6-N-acetylglucosamine synthase-like glycosyltransferase
LAATGAESLPFVSFVIAAHNEEAVIAKKLENTLACDYPPERLQVLVASEGSSDRTPDIVAEFLNRGVEQSFRPERRGKVTAINGAMEHVRGEVVVFSDANNFYEPTALRRLVAAFADPEVGATTGAKTVRRDGSAGNSEGLYWRYESFIKRKETRLGSCIGAAGEIFAVRRSLIEPIPAEVINDDFYLAMRVVCRGHRVVYVPDARSWEPASPSLAEERVRRARIVAGRFQICGMAASVFPWRRPVLLWQLFSHKLARPLIPWAMLTALAANVVAWSRPPAPGSGWLQLESPLAVSLLAGQALFYVVAVVGWRVVPQGRLSKLFVLPAFVASSNAAAISGLVGYVTGRQTAVWRRVSRTRQAV